MRDTLTGEYTLSFRSTESQYQVAGGDWEREGLPGADGEIAGTGFALAQLVSMEKYYRALKADPRNSRRGPCSMSPAIHWAAIWRRCLPNSMPVRFRHIHL